MATVWSNRCFSPATVRSPSATLGNASIANWFQIPVIVTASVTALAAKPHARSIPYERATPTAGPPGAMKVEAVVESESTRALR